MEENETYQKLLKMSNKDAIIYIASKYKDEILNENFLSQEKGYIGYRKIAQDFEVDSSELYKYFTFKLRINDMKNIFDRWNSGIQWKPNEEWEKKEKRIDKIEKDFYKTHARFTTNGVWRLLAYHCKFYNRQSAKRVLREIQKWRKDKQRLQELFTPLFFPYQGYKYSKFIYAKIDKKCNKKGNKMPVYKGTFLPFNQRESPGSQFKDLYNENCLIIASEKEKEEIDKLIKEKKVPMILGVRNNPFRNKTNKILKIGSLPKQ